MTCTIVGWLPNFTRPEAVNILLDSWRFLQRERDFRLCGYVILENHLHMIASAAGLPKLIKDSKSFTARQIIDLLEKKSETTLLKQLRFEALRRYAQRLQNQLLARVAAFGLGAGDHDLPRQHRSARLQNVHTSDLPFHAFQSIGVRDLLEGFTIYR